jgi:hypothetical protein
MIEREIQIELTKSRKEYPVICITGPRQSGKTTLARAAFPKLPYVSDENPGLHPDALAKRFRSDQTVTS